MTKNKGKKHSQHRNTSDKYAAKIIEPEQVIALGASANVDKKLLRQLEKQKKDEEYAATAREAEQKKSAELKKKQKANKGNTPKKRIEIPPSIQPLEIPEKGGFKGASENKESDESQRAAGFRGSTSKSSTFNDNKHPRVHGPSYGLQKQDGPERDFRGDVTKFSAPYKYPRVEAPYYNKYDKTYDQSFKDFMQKKNIKCDHIKENIGDLFSAPDEYSLAHCVAEDFNMGAGIALTFRAKYKQVSYLLNQNQGTGGLAVLKYEKRFIYYLVTKQVSRGKPTLHTLWQSLQKLRQHCEANNVTKLAMPQIGCGLDKLDWNKVKQMLAYVFEGTSVEIVVYVWDKSATEDPQMAKPLLRKCFVAHQVLPVIQVGKDTGLIYFATVDGSETEQIANIAARCSVLPSTYKREPKRLGDVIRTEDGREFIYGLVVKQNTDSTYDFAVMERALQNLRDAVAKDKYEFVAFEGFVVENDDVISDKIISLMQFILKEYVQICVC